MDNRPCYRVAAVGLEAREVKLIEIVFRHSTHNPFAYQLASPDERDLAELAIVDPSRPEGAHYVDRSAAALGPDGLAKPMVLVVAPALIGQFPGAVALDRLTLQLLPILNRLVREQITMEAASGGVTGDAAAPAATAAALATSSATARVTTSVAGEAVPSASSTAVEPIGDGVPHATMAKTGSSAGLGSANASPTTGDSPGKAFGSPAASAPVTQSPGPANGAPEKTRQSVWGRVFGDSAAATGPAGTTSAQPGSVAGKPEAAGLVADKAASATPAGASVTVAAAAAGVPGGAAAAPATGSAHGAQNGLATGLTTGFPTGASGSPAGLRAGYAAGAVGATGTSSGMPMGASGSQQAVRLGEHAAVAARQMPTSAPGTSSVPGANVLPLPAASVVRALPQGPLHAVQSGAGSGHSVPAQTAPAAHHATQAQTGSAGAMAAAPTEPAFKLRILVVDDSPTVQRQLMRTLNSMGLVCDLAGDGATAMLALQHEHYDVVLVDLMLPDTDGVQLTRRIRKDKRLRGIPIIVLTGRTSPLDHARAALAGATMYLSKPISLKTLESALVKVLRRTLAIDELRLYMKPLGSQQAGASVSAQGVAQASSSAASGASSHGGSGPQGQQSPQGPEPSASRTGG